MRSLLRRRTDAMHSLSTSQTMRQFRRSHLLLVFSAPHEVGSSRTRPKAARTFAYLVARVFLTSLEGGSPTAPHPRGMLSASPRLPRGLFILANFFHSKFLRGINYSIVDIYLALFILGTATKSRKSAGSLPHHRHRSDYLE